MAFRSIVDLCRDAESCCVAGSDLVITSRRTPSVVAWLDEIHDSGWDTTFRVGGVDTTRPVHLLGEGDQFVVVMHGMTRTNPVVQNDVSSLLCYNMGEFLGKVPTNYFIISCNYASWEIANDWQVLAYLRLVKLVDFLKSFADVVTPVAGSAGEAIFFSSRKLVMPLVYDEKCLYFAPSEDDIESFKAELAQEAHKSSRIDILKRVLGRFFDQEVERERFTQLARRFKEIRLAYDADFDIFSTGFTFDKVREEFEKKKFDFIVKVNSSSSDVMNKLIAIPVGQGLLASQMKAGPEFFMANWALLCGSIIFSIIAFMLLVSQVNTLDQIKQDFKQECDLLKQRANPTYQRLEGMIKVVRKKMSLHRYWMPWVLMLILLASFLITLFAFNAVMPNAWEGIASV